MGLVGWSVMTVKESSEVSINSAKSPERLYISLQNWSNKSEERIGNPPKFHDSDGQVHPSIRILSHFLCKEGSFSKDDSYLKMEQMKNDGMDGMGCDTGKGEQAQ